MSGEGDVRRGEGYCGAGDQSDGWMAEAATLPLSSDNALLAPSLALGRILSRAEVL